MLNVNLKFTTAIYILFQLLHDFEIAVSNYFIHLKHDSKL